MEVITNNHKRPLLSLAELSDREREEFDYVPAECEHDIRFFRYRGEVYDSQEFCVIVPMDQGASAFAHRAPNGSPLLAWTAIQTDSFSSAIVLRYAEEDGVEDWEHVIVGRVYS